MFRVPNKLNVPIMIMCIRLAYKDVLYVVITLSFHVELYVAKLDTSKIMKVEKMGEQCCYLSYH